MSEPEDFLSRWSRRKQDVAREEEAAKPEAPTELQDGEQDSVEENSPPENENKKPSDTAAKEPAFDLSKLPSIDSITATTDIRPFLAAGVPTALRNAALRRVWVADPKIRDFIEMAENQWDFTGATEVPGFDFSPPGGDIRRLVAEILGEKAEEKEEPMSSSDSPDLHEAADEHLPTVETGASHRNVIDPPPGASANMRADGTGEIEKDASANSRFVTIGERENIASQNNDAARNAPTKISRRSHGGAMPK
jgi:hypothetical protein